MSRPGRAPRFLSLFSLPAVAVAWICPLLVLLAAEAPPTSGAAPASDSGALEAASPPADRSPAAPDATAGLVEDLTHEEARAREFQSGLKRFGTGLLETEEREKARGTVFLDRAASLASELQSAAAAGAAADLLYRRIVEELMNARPALHDALYAVRQPSSVPTFVPALDTGRLQAPSVSARLAALEALLAEIRTSEDRLRKKESAQRWETVELRAHRVERLDALRIESLARLSPEGRSEILGFTRAGIAQLGREIDQLNLSFRLYLARRWQELGALRDRIRDVFLLGTATYSLLKVALILAASLFLRRRGTAILEGTRRAVLQRPRGVRWTRRVEALFGAIRVLAPWSLFLAALWSLKWAMGDAIRWPEVLLLYRILLLYGWYRLASASLVALVVRIARLYRLRLDAARTDMIVGSIRTIMRVLAGIAILLALSQRFLGRGYLYHLVVELAWMVVLLALFRILARWRTVIAEAYLAIGPPGRLAALVRGTRDRWFGVFVAAASFGWLAGRAGLILARDFALGFDQTRKALAFLFRRRMEKQAERQGYSEGDPGSLPPVLLAAFSEETVSEGPHLIDHFPGLDRLEASLDAWSAGRAGGACLLGGETGIGKSTWLARVRADGVPISRMTLARRVHRAADLAAVLSEGLDLGPGPGTNPGSLRVALLAGAPRLIIVDHGERLFLSALGGYDAFEEFASLVESTCRRVFWLCSFTSFAHDHLSAVRPDLSVFRARHLLPAWSERDIRALIRARTAASRVEFTYEDLVVDRMEGVSSDASLLETEEGYTRLLWDYSDGNPRVALHFWIRSLVPESPARARVRLFRAPSPEKLEEGGETGLFILAAIVLHENLTLSESVLVTCYPEEVCRIHLNRLLEIGALRLEADRYRLTTHWHRAVVRLLKRRNLLPD